MYGPVHVSLKYATDIDRCKLVNPPFITIDTAVIDQCGDTSET